MISNGNINRKKHNLVADALSRKNVTEFFGAISQVQSDIEGQIRELVAKDPGYQKLLEQVKEGTVCRYWIDDGLSHAKGNRLFIPVGAIRCCLLR